MIERSGGVVFAAETVNSSEFSPELCSLCSVFVATDMIEMLLFVLASAFVWQLIFSMAYVAARRLGREALCNRPNAGEGLGFNMGLLLRCAQCKRLILVAGCVVACYGIPGCRVSRLLAGILWSGP